MNLQIKLILSVSVPHFFAQSMAQLKLTVFITDKHLLNFIIDDTLFAASADEEIARVHPRRQVWHDSPHFFWILYSNFKVKP